MATDHRRSTAAQFFMDEDEAAKEGMTTNDRVVELLNQTSLLQKDSQRLSNLKLVQELIVHKEPDLLDNFLDEMLAYQNDKSVEVKKFVVSFTEEACKADPEILPKIIGNLSMLLVDENVNLVKKVMLSMTQLYKVVIQWLSKSKNPTEAMQTTWQYTTQMKNRICDMLDSDNDGVRTHSIKFIENLVIVLSKRTPDSDVPKRSENDISLEQIKEDHPVLHVKRLEDEGSKMFEGLIEFQASSHISSVNLMTCLSSMASIAKQRPQYMYQVVLAFEGLHVNLPPTLSKSQVSSVRKNLKMQMLQVLRHPASIDYHTQITTLLTDLGATMSEVGKNMPKPEEIRKRKAEMEIINAKKAKVEASTSKIEFKLKDEEEDYGMTPLVGLGKAKQGSVEMQKQSAIDITAEDLIDRLTPQNVADLVLLSMVMLPETMPPQFQATYTPIAAAGTTAQIKHLSRLLATQLTAGGLGKGVAEIKHNLPVTATEEKEMEVEDEDEEPQASSPKQTIQTLVGGHTARAIEEKPDPTFLAPPPVQSVTQPTRKGIKQFKLGAVTKPIDFNLMDDFAMEAMHRILKADKVALQGNVASTRVKTLTSIVTQFGGMFKDTLQNYIFADLRNRSELALAWIYQEYANYSGYTSSQTSMEKPSIAAYDECLTRLLNGLLARPDAREGLFSRLLLEAPCITSNAIQVLRKYCQDETRIYLGMTTLKELILKRPTMKLEFLDVLLDFTSHPKLEVRTNAIRVVKKLHEYPELKNPIERSALFSLKYLLRPLPPSELTSIAGRQYDNPEQWTEESIKLCLYLYLGLLPINHALIHELANVYTGTTADIKRTVLRVLENPVKGMGMHSPELLRLVENCPKGAETLVTRIIHILTDKTAPSKELVERVRDLYQKRVSDVRFLIPVLNGLHKREVIAALPKLIKLNPVVVKEVFNRLLGNSNQDAGYTSPLTPAELLVALHNIDHTQCDMKTVIKACSLCFNERSVYTQEVLAVVMQQLMEQNPLPTLLMRTVLQSFAMYPKLIGIVLNIMQRLVHKQVWKNKKVWEGFVRCCKRTDPQSYQVLLQLPAEQLKNAFEICPELRMPLLQHVQDFTPNQRAMVPKAIMVVMEKDPMEEQLAAERARREEQEMAEQERLYQEKKLQEDRQREEDRKQEEVRQQGEAQKQAEERQRQQEQQKVDEQQRQEALLKQQKEEEERKKNADQQAAEAETAEPQEAEAIIKQEPSEGQAVIVKVEQEDSDHATVTVSMRAPADSDNIQIVPTTEPESSGDNTTPTKSARGRSTRATRAKSPAAARGSRRSGRSRKKDEEGEGDEGEEEPMDES